MFFIQIELHILAQLKITGTNAERKVDFFIFLLVGMKKENLETLFKLRLRIKI